MTDSRSRIPMHLFDVRDVTFQLRRRGRREPFDVTGMTLRLTWERVEIESEYHPEPYVADPLHPNADFAEGKVVFRVDTRLTGVQGSYNYSLELDDPVSGEWYVLETGRIEVAERPGFPPDYPITGVIDADPLLTGDLVVA